MNYSGMRGNSLLIAGVVMLLLAAMFLSSISCGRRSQTAAMAGRPFSGETAGIGNTGSAGFDTPESIEIREEALDTVLTEIDTYPTPSGIDAALFEELRNELRRQIEARETNRLTSAVDA